MVKASAPLWMHTLVTLLAGGVWLGIAVANRTVFLAHPLDPSLPAAATVLLGRKLMPRFGADVEEEEGQGTGAKG